jgi:hypothetical protein
MRTPGNEALKLRQVDARRHAAGHGPADGEACPTPSFVLSLSKDGLRGTYLDKLGTNGVDGGAARLPTASGGAA